MDDAGRLRGDSDLAGRLLSTACPGLTLGPAIIAIDELVAAGVADPLQLLPSYCDWLVQRTQRVRDFLSRQSQGEIS